MDMKACSGNYHLHIIINNILLIKKDYEMRTFYFTFLIIVFLSCNNNNSPTEPQNHAPIIQDILLSNPSPKIGSGVYISAVATDADGDSLSYYWTCSAGDFPPWYTSGLSYDVPTNPT